MIPSESEVHLVSMDSQRTCDTTNVHVWLAVLQDIDYSAVPLFGTTDIIVLPSPLTHPTPARHRTNQVLALRLMILQF